MTAIIRIILIVDISYTNCPFKKCQELLEFEEYAVVGEEFIFILKKREIFYPLNSYITFFITPTTTSMYLSLILEV